jgi:thiamine biosynthesis lipoprotein ApbE
MTSLVHSSTIAHMPLYECHTVMLGRPAYVGLIGARWSVDSDALVPDALDDGRARLAELDHLWGRGGEIERLNARPGVMTPVSADTVLLAVLATEPVARRRCQRPAEPSLRVDVRHDAVGLLADAPVDLGDLAAALAVDLVLGDLMAAGNAGNRLAGACVMVGGNARAIGTPPPGREWPVAVAGDRRPLRRAAIAYTRSDHTSAMLSLVLSSASSSVLVVADQAWRAHLLGTAALTLPPDRACGFLRDTASAARLTAPDGTVHTVGSWEPALSSSS